MNDKIYTIEEIKAVITPIARKYPLKQIYLFGSYARSEATAESDIDLSIEFIDDSHSTLRTLSDLIEDLERSLGKRVDCINVNSMSLGFRYEIIDDEVLMYA